MKNSPQKPVEARPPQIDYGPGWSSQAAWYLRNTPRPELPVPAQIEQGIDPALAGRKEYFDQDLEENRLKSNNFNKLRPIAEEFQPLDIWADSDDEAAKLILNGRNLYYHSNVITKIVLSLEPLTPENLALASDIVAALEVVKATGATDDILMRFVEALADRLPEQPVGLPGTPASNLPGPKLPEEAPEPYVPRKSGKASDFLVAHYGRWLEARALYRPQLTKLDPALKAALDEEFRGRTEEYAILLPKKSAEVDRRLEEAVGGAVPPERRNVVARALSQLRATKPKV